MSEPTLPQEQIPEELPSTPIETPEVIQEPTPALPEEHTEAPQDVSFIPQEIPAAPSANSVPTIPQLSVALAMLLVVLGTPYAISKYRAYEAARLPEQSGMVGEGQARPVEAADPFADISLEAKAAYVWDAALDKPLYAKNAHAQLPLASLTKLMTGLVAYETLGAEALVAIDLNAISEDGEDGFDAGDAWHAQELLEFTMISSSNDGAHALAAAAAAHEGYEDGVDAFIERMNDKARELGLNSTRFTNMTGLDLSEAESGSYGSARDVALLMEHLITKTPKVVAGTTREIVTYTDSDGEEHTATNTNPGIAHLANPLGSKTGYTSLAGGNLAVAFDAGLNHPVVIVVLGSTREGRFSDVEELTERTMRALSQMP